MLIALCSWLFAHMIAFLVLKPSQYWWFGLVIFPMHSQNVSQWHGYKIQVPLYYFAHYSLLTTLNLRFVSVDYFLCHVFQPLPVKFTQRNLCCISKYMMKHKQKQNGRLGLSWFNYNIIIENASLVIPNQIRTTTLNNDYTWKNLCI